MTLTPASEKSGQGSRGKRQKRDDASPRPSPGGEGEVTDKNYADTGQHRK